MNDMPKMKKDNIKAKRKGICQPIILDQLKFIACFYGVEGPLLISCAYESARFLFVS